MKLNMAQQGGLSDEFIAGGGNVIGPLILLHDPQVPLEAATKQYVDNSFSSLNASNIISGTLSTARLPGMNGDLTSAPGSGNLILSDTGVTPGSYAKVTVNNKGRVTNGVTLTNSDIPNFSFSKITSGKPSTLAGYGITDAIAITGGTLTDYVNMSSSVTAATQLANKAYITAASGNIGGISVGDLIANVDTTTPVGFLRCNGAELDKTVYSSLYSVIGNRYTSVNEAGSGQPWRQQYQINDMLTPDIQYWTTGTSLPVTFARSSAVVTKNKVYLLGGHNGTSYVSTVYRADINADGTLGAWVTDTSLPGAVGLSQAIVTKNRVYLMGGVNSSDVATSTVYTAPINSDGTLGAWTTGTSLPVGLRSSQAIVTKNRVYLLGGAITDGNTDVSTVYTAPINTDGTLGTWTTGTSIIAPLKTSQAIVTKNRVYLLGGNNGSTAVSTVYTAFINSDGTLSTWSTGTSLPVSVAIAQSIVTKNRVYLLGGQTTGAVDISTVYTAPINDDGTLGTWAVGTSIPGPLRTSQAIVTKNKVYLLGGINGSLVSTVYTAPINGGLNDYSAYYAVDNSVNYMEPGSGKPWQQQYQINQTQTADITGWITDSSVLPGALAYSSVIVTKNRVYLCGGYTGSAYVSTVYTASINTDGTLGTWTTDTSLPGILATSQAIVTSNRVYLLGGNNNSADTSVIYIASINADGTLGTWYTDTSLPGNLSTSISIVTKNRVYLLGGANTSIVSTVYTAPINTDGTLGTWSAGTSLPVTLSRSQAIVTKNRVYLLGGNNGSTAVSTVYTAFINSDGTLSTWSTGTSLPGALSNSSVIVTKNRVYLLGGYNGTSAVSTVYTAPINNDGTLGTWTTGTSLPGVTQISQSIVTKNRVYLLGGHNGGYVSTIYSAPLLEGLNDYSTYYVADTNNYMMPGSGKPWQQQYQINNTQTANITGWTADTSLPGVLSNSHSIVTKNRVYMLGGYNGSATVSTVYTAPINSDGTLGAWTTGTSLPGVLGMSQAIVTKNRVYILGGQISGGSVYTATINTDGTLGSWTTGLSLPGVLFASQAIVTKNRVYLLGGNNGSYVSTVYTTTINTDGTLGTWTTGTSLPGILTYSQAIVTKNRVYILGGYDGTNYSSVVYTAPINTDGTIGTWTTGTSLPGGLNVSQAIVTKNRVYLLGGHNGSVHVSTVYTAPINTDGTLGTWTTGTSLPGGFSNSSTIVTKNRVYLLSGYNGTSYTSTVYTASILEGLNDYSPYYDGTIVAIEPAYPPGYIIPSTVFKIPDHSLSDTSLNYFIKY